MRFVGVVLFAVTLAGCSVKVDDGNKPQEVPNKPNNVGPFDLKLSDSRSQVPNEFSVDIAQDAGHVDFNIKPEERTKMEFVSAVTTVTGCDASKVSITHFWYEDADKTKTPTVVRPAHRFYASPKVKNTLSVAFINMSGCKKLTYKLIVKKMEWPKRPQSWDTDLDPRLLGNWSYEKDNYRIQLFISSAPSIGWLEDNGVNYTCDRTLRTPKTSSSLDPNWLIDDGQGLECIYKLSTDKEKMTVTCESKGWTCKVPDEFEFYRK